MMCGLDVQLAAVVDACAIVGPVDDDAPSTSEWLLQMSGSLVGAAAGAAGAYFAQARFAAAQDRKQFKTRRDETIAELGAIADATDDRAARDGYTVEFDAPLPAGAWARLLDGGHRDRLDDVLFSDLDALYRKLAALNFGAGQTGALLQVSTLAHDADQRKAFRESLTELSSDAYAGVGDRARDLAQRLGQVVP